MLDSAKFIAQAPNRRSNMKRLLNRLWTEDAGQDLTEYALLVVLIALAAIAAVSQFAAAIAGVFNNAGASLAAPT